MRFLDLELEDPVPDATTIWLFREALVEAGLIDKLFARFRQHLEAAGYLARGGQIVGAQAAQYEEGERGDQGRQDAGGMGAATCQECPEGQGRALDEKERRELVRLQQPCRGGRRNRHRRRENWGKLRPTNGEDSTPAHRMNRIVNLC